MRVVDKDGEWHLNTGEFRILIADREGTDQTFLEPGEYTKIRSTPYLAGQPTVKIGGDPLGDDAPAPKAKK